MTIEHAIHDAHTHFFSRRFFEALEREAAAGRPPGEHMREVTAAVGIELPPDDHLAWLERWLMALDAAQVESAVSFASVPEEAELVGEAARLSGGRLTAFAAVQPLAAGAAAFVGRALDEWGHRGIVLFPALHGFLPGDAAVEPVLEEVARRRGVCVVHCGVLRMPLRDRFGLARPSAPLGANPLAVVAAANRHPDLAFVIPHLGGGLFREALLAVAWCDNIYLDTSSSNEWMKAQVPKLTLTQALERALDVAGPGRLLFGSDSSIFPRGYRRDVLLAQTAALAEIGLGAAEREKVMGGNLRRLLGG